MLVRDGEFINVGMQTDGLRLFYYAVDDIKQGDELFIYYGEDYWAARQYQSPTKLHKGL